MGISGVKWSEMSLPPEYLAALVPLAEAFSAYEKATGGVAVLVGGAAAAIHTDGAFMSADFDVVAGNDAAFDRAMATSGFVDDEKALHGQGGWYHSAHPQFAVEQVSGGYFDGRADKTRCLKLTVRGKAGNRPACYRRHDCRQAGSARSCRWRHVHAGASAGTLCSRRGFRP